MKTRSRIFGLLTVVLAFLLACTMVACGNDSNGMYIDVPSEAVECELGEYTIEIPNVRDADGFVISDRTVTIKSAATEDGTAVTVSSSNTITINEPAIVKVTFQASGVSDAVMTLDFADRSAPEITLAESLPSMYFSGNSYAVPHYTANETLKNTSFKVDWYESASAQPVSVELTGYGFSVDNSTGFYRITIHVEDNWGNSEDYTYDVPVGGVSDDVYEEGTIVYFENEFGLEQATNRFNNLGMEYVAADQLPEGMVDDTHDIAGATKVWRDAGNPTGTTTGEADIVLSMPYITNLSAYDTIYVDVYNPTSENLTIQIAWGGTAVLKPNAWTRVSWDIEILQMTNNAGGSRSDITGLVLCLATSETDGKGLTQEGEEVLYFANMGAAKNGATEYRVPADDVKADKIFYTDTPAGVDNFFLRDGNWNNYTVEYVEFGGDLPQDSEGPAESKGMTKVSFSGISGSAGHLDTVNSYLTSLSDYAYMAWRVYNPNSFAIELSYHTGGNDGNTSAPACTIPAESFGTFYISFDYLDTYAYNRLLTRSANDIWLYVNGANGQSIDGASVYFGACYGIRYTDLKAEIDVSDCEMDLNNTFDGGTYAPVVSDSAAAEWTRGDTLGSIYYKLSSAIMDGASRVPVSDGKFTVTAVGEHEYSLTYTAYMYTVTGGQVGEEVELSSVLDDITADVTIKVINAEDMGKIEGDFVISKNADDELATITVPASSVPGTFVRLVDGNSRTIGATAETAGDNLVITITADGLKALESGETELQIVMNANDTNSYYTIDATVWQMIISDETELLEFSAMLDAAASESNALAGWFLLDDDIDMSASDHVFGDFAGDPNSRQGTRYFAGVFDGDGHSITGLKLGNKGLFNWVTASGIVKNIALVDAYAYGYAADGTQTQQNVTHGSNILAEGFYGTLENVFVSGSVGPSRWSYSGLVWQMRAEAVRDCVFDITLRSDATSNIDTALGAWIVSGSNSTKTIDNVVLITESEKVCNLGGNDKAWELPQNVTLFADAEACLAGIDMAGFDSPLWAKTDDGITFGGTLVVFKGEEVTSLPGSYVVSKTAADNKLSFKLEDTSLIKGEFVSFAEEEGVAVTCDYSNGTFTFTAENLANVIDGANTFILTTKDGETTYKYGILLTVYKNFISDEAELLAFAEDLDGAKTSSSALTGWYKLDADIDMTESGFVFGDLYGNPTKDTAGDRYFAGTFDGDGHSIIGIKTGNKGIFNMVQSTAVVKNVAFVDAYAFGYNANGTQTEQNVSHGSNILSEQFAGTLQNVFVSGSVGATNWGFTGTVERFQTTAKVSNVVFDVELRSAGTYDSVTGIVFEGNTFDDFVVITSAQKVFSVGGAASGSVYDKAGVSVYANEAACLAGIDMSGFDSALWGKTEGGITFGGEIVVSDVTTEDAVALQGGYELSKSADDGKLSVTLTDYATIQGDFVSVSTADGMILGGAYADGTITFTAAMLGLLRDGENTLVVKTKDGDVYRQYTVSVTVYSCFISNPTELKAFGDAFVAAGKGNLFNGWYKLDANIDMTSEEYVFGNYDTGNSNSASHVRFAGVFDGAGHTITGVKTGNGGLFGYVERAGVIKNVAIVNATGQGAYSSTILGGGWFLGTLENVFVSGSIGNGSSPQDGIIAQNRAQSMKNVVFDVDIADEATRSLLGIWVSGETNEALHAGVVENFFAITNATGDAAYTWAGDANNEITLYADVATCLETEDFADFDSSVWELKADGVYFGGNKIIDIANA